MIRFKATGAGEARPGWAITSAQPSIGAYLALAFLTVLAALLLGMRLARQSTSQTIQLTGSVASQYEPVLRASRELAESLAGFERAVVDRTHAGPFEVDAEVPAPRLLAVYEQYMALAATTAGAPPPELGPRLLDFQKQGWALMELCRQRDAEIRTGLQALNTLVARAARAGRGIELGDQVLAPKSLDELARAAAALRVSARALIAAPAQGAIAAVTVDQLAVATVLRTHAAEFRRSPGGAWLELMQDDFATSRRAQRRFLALERNIAVARGAFEGGAREIGMAIDHDLQAPAWQALTRAAGRARLAAEDTESHLARLTVAMLAGIGFMGALLLFGIAAPVRRLLEGTRRLAGGTLDARVQRGGVRELDELAVAFNDMAAALDASQQNLREHQLVLEERISQRTRELHHLAHHDPLTELPNRRELAARLATTIARARKAGSDCAVLFMDVDNFKTINDSLGHEFGDQVLRAIGARLQEAATPRGFLARLGGDEFTVVLEDVAGTAAAGQYAGQIMRAFARPLDVGGRELLASLSVGIAMYPEHGDDAEALLRAADSALYDAKDRGRNGFQIYRAELLKAASHRFHTEQALRRALEQDEFLLYFQPEIALAEKRTTVIEALLRWRQPDGRIVAAAEFIDVAEQSGLILELTDWLLHRAVAAARELRAGVWPQARVAINVSAQQFLSGRFVDTVARTLSELEMPADCLEVELTESALQTGRLAVEALHELRRMGVAVALDDFGAGYSTLKSIEELPLTRVKLDRSLLRDIESSTGTAAFAHSCIRLCQSLGLTVTAEGIERPEQLDALALCGGIQVQGYLIARPAPLDQIVGFITATAARLAAVWPQTPAGRRDDPEDGAVAPVTALRPRTR